MTIRPRTGQVPPESRTESTATRQRYAIAIGGVYNRTISGAAAESTFSRWREHPDVLMHGDLKTGFFWQWPDWRRTRITITPVANQRAVTSEADSSRTGSAPLSVSGELP
jgi:hypothetical protein